VLVELLDDDQRDHGIGVAGANRLRVEMSTDVSSTTRVVGGATRDRSVRRWQERKGRLEIVTGLPTLGHRDDRRHLQRSPDSADRRALPVRVVAHAGRSSKAG
jgi:hypothetical protein